MTRRYFTNRIFKIEKGYQWTFKITTLCKAATELTVCYFESHSIFRTSSGNCWILKPSFFQT